MNDDLTKMTDAMDRALRYGVQETNNIAFAAYDSSGVDHSAGTFSLGDRDLVKIDRIRLLTDPGFPYYDVSYVYGTLRDGRHVRVDLGSHQLPKRGLKGELIRLAKQANRYAKGLGMLDDSTISILR